MCVMIKRQLVGVNYRLPPCERIQTLTPSLSCKHLYMLTHLTRPELK